MSHQGGGPGKTQDTLERTMSLGWPGKASRGPPGRAGGSVWEMDSADANTIKTALDTQAYRLKHHDAQLSNIAAGVKQLTDSQADLQASVATKVNQLTDQMQSLTSRLEGFIAAFAISAGRSGSTSFTGYCCCCASSAASSGAIFLACLLRSGPPGLTTEVFRRVRRLPHGKASSALLKIQQGCRRVVDYVLEFRTLAADSGWNETSIHQCIHWPRGGSKRLSGSVGHPKGLRKPSRNSLSHRQSPP
ncbi:hypothetical protein L3Q82_004109 [Scortum barcoo]|uniref:Uncharacterized protein n=1 Tax=Scortum barcoo TaxID=214431 RepID=A0ACB8X6T6_9TELE|nr:hypothetical protein L3Q82_004109 [Scortum barcoo]